MTNSKDRLLLVDDQLEMVWDLGRCLARAGFVVTTCGDASEALPLLEAKTFDILVTDIQMPNLNGLALIEWVRQNRPSIKTVVMTAFGSPSLKEVALRKGAILYLEKPIDPDLLVEVLRASAHSKSFTGAVNEIELVDYVQLMLLTRRQSVLQVTNVSGEEGFLFIDRGNVVHATCGDLVGEGAFYFCLSFEGGSFNTLPWREPDAVTITMRGENLLMESQRLKDERGAPRAEEPSLDIDLALAGFDVGEKGDR